MLETNGKVSSLSPFSYSDMVVGIYSYIYTILHSSG